MKKNRFFAVVFCAMLVAVCAFLCAPALAEVAVNRVEPLPPTLDTEHLTDCMFYAAFASDDVYLNDDGALVIHMTVYDYELFDLVDIANLAVGDTIVIDGAEQTVASIQADEESGYLLINGGYDEDGYTMTTDENGVYYVMDVNDSRHYRALGEATLRVDQEFTMEDSSDLDSPEKILYAGDLLTDIAPYDVSFFPDNTLVTFAGGFITKIEVFYVP